MKRYFSYLPVLAVLYSLSQTGCIKQSLDSDILGSSSPSLAPLLSKQKGVKFKPDEYVVVFKDEVSDVDISVEDIGKKHKFKAKHRYKHVLKGFTGKISRQAVQALRADPRIEYIEPDIEVSLATTQTSVPSWGLDRIDQRALPLDGSYSYQYTGASVDAYIFDTGIRLTHQEFHGRVVNGFDAYDYDGVADDDHGHGTHVAGTVGGSKFGIAKKVRLIAVRVLGPTGNGYASDVIAGFDWAVKHHTNKPAVGNISLGSTGSSQSMEDGVKRMIADGITICAAAGNQGVDADNFTPGRETSAITVGATSIDDQYVDFSNYGAVVDVFAPGLDVISAGHLSDNASADKSGTSMAAPHATGVAALYLEAHPQASPAEVQHALKTNASLFLIKSLPYGTPNRLLVAEWDKPMAPAAPFAPAVILPSNYGWAVSMAPVFSWDKSLGASAYRLQISKFENFSSVVYDRWDIAATTASGILLTGNTTYYWRVNAANSLGVSGWSATRQFTTSSTSNGIIPYAYVPFSTATDVSIPTTFTWSESSGAQSYRLQVSTNPEFTKLVYSVSNVTSTSTTIPGLAVSTIYYWRVRANYLSNASGWSTVNSFQTWGP